jgi:hypothetical protein
VTRHASPKRGATRHASTKGVRPVIYLWLYLAMCGVWPLAEPSHGDLTSVMTWLDLTTHILGCVWFVQAFVQLGQEEDA